VRALLAPYLDAIEACNPAGRLVAEGSPALVRSWLRSQDRLLACELEPGAASPSHATCAAMSGSGS
jgi:23S rRNA (adenine2030-N6)-methyltransferase